MPQARFSLSGLVLLLLSTSSVFADHWAYVPLRPQAPGAPASSFVGLPRGTAPVRALPRGPIQQVSGEYVVGSDAMPCYGEGIPAQRRYPQMHAPLYPCPTPNVPVQVGGTTITNQALAPHEMMYRHKYKALFPPYYYKVSGSWLKTPWGMESHDKWELQGTEVTVNYRDRYSLFSGFHPPTHGFRLSRLH